MKLVIMFLERYRNQIQKCTAKYKGLFHAVTSMFFVLFCFSEICGDQQHSGFSGWQEPHWALRPVKKNPKKLGATKHWIVCINQTCRQKPNIWVEPKHSGKLYVLLISETVLNQRQNCCVVSRNVSMYIRAPCLLIKLTVYCSELHVISAHLSAVVFQCHFLAHQSPA